MHTEPEEETAHPSRVPQSISTMGSVPAMGSLSMPSGMMMNGMDLAMSSLAMNGLNGMDDMGAGMMNASSMLVESENMPSTSAVNSVLDSSSSAPDATHSHSQPQNHTSAPGEPSQSQQAQSSSSSALNTLATRGIDALSMTELADLSVAGNGDSIASSFPGLSRPLKHNEKELLGHLDRLKFFLATAPSRWSADGAVNGMFFITTLISACLHLM